MVRFLISAAFILVFLFIFFLLCSAMLWVGMKVLRLLFPGMFKPSEKRSNDVR